MGTSKSSQDTTQNTNQSTSGSTTGATSATGTVGAAGSSTQNPWDAALPALQGILGGINGQMGNYAPTGAEQGALNTLQQNAQGVGNYAPQATGLANDLMSGGGTAQNAGILGNAYQQYQNQLNPIANQNNDPTQAPGMQALLNTIMGDVSNSVNGMFAGAGRDMSGMNTQTLARGMSQGLAAPLLAQYNQNVQNQMGAAGNLFGAGGATANGLQGFNQQGFANQAQGLDTAINGVPLAMNNQANQILQAGQTARNLPLSNLGMLAGLTVPLAGLGGTTNTTNAGTTTNNGTTNNTMQGTMQGNMVGSTQGTQTMSPFQMAMMALGGGSNGPMAGVGKGLGVLGSFF